MACQEVVLEEPLQVEQFKCLGAGEERTSGSLSGGVSSGDNRLQTFQLLLPMPLYHHVSPVATI